MYPHLPTHSPAKLCVDGQHVRVANEGKSHNRHSRTSEGMAQVHEIRAYKVPSLPLHPFGPNFALHIRTWKSPIPNTWLHYKKSILCVRTRGPECGANPLGLHTHLRVNCEHPDFTASVEPLHGKAWGALALHYCVIAVYSTDKLEIPLGDLGEGRCESEVTVKTMSQHLKLSSNFQVFFFSDSRKRREVACR